MADFTEIIQEINTNLPDNNTQAITAAKLRTTMIDLTEAIENQQDSFEQEIISQYSPVTVIDNVTSTSATDALSANQGRILNDGISKLNESFTENTLMENTSVVSGKYIDSSGNLVSASWATTRVYEVQPGEKYYLTGLRPSGDLRTYAIYNSSTVFDNTTLVKLGVKCSTNAGQPMTITAPEESVVLLTTDYSTTYLPKLYHIDLVDVIQFKTDTLAEFSTIDEEISDINTSISEIEEKLVYTKYETLLTYDSQISGKYISSNGNQSNLAANNLYLYTVTPGQKLQISVPQASGSMRKFGFYSSTGLSSSTLIEIGPSVTGASTIYYRTVPQNATVLVLSSYQNASVSATLGTDYQLAAVVEEQEQKIYQAEADIDQLQNEQTYANKYAYRYIGGTNGGFQVVYNDGSGVEMYYYFRKCMANNLYTFYRVGYQTTDRNYPVIPSNTSVFTMINSTASDNIGPLNMRYGYEGNSGWVGGNHHYPNETATTLYNTAVNVSFQIFADNKEITTEGEIGFANSIVILVNNTIFDPSFPPEEGATSLSTKLCDELVRYTICRNTIEVALTHKYVETTTNRINTYYGMQSMFNNESKLITPNGYYTNWTNTSTSMSSFTKGDYPNFNRFIEYSASNNDFQSTYLYPIGIGNHRYIDNSDIIFKHTSDKSYHSLIDALSNIGGICNSWSGSYTFFHTPIVNDENVFAYWGTVNGKLTMFINTMGAYEGFVPVPSQFAIKSLNTIEHIGITSQDDDYNFYINGGGVYIKSTGVGSLILECDE